MRPIGSADELHRRRLRAVELVRGGNGPTAVAEMVGAHRRTVQRWTRRLEKGGREALNPVAHPGRKPRLTVGQKRQLIRHLLKGAKAHGFGTDLWTLGRIARIIRRRFGVTYHESHVSRLLRSLNWSAQKPQKKAYERDEKAIQRWVRRDWPRIRTSPTA